MNNPAYPAPAESPAPASSVSTAASTATPSWPEGVQRVAAELQRLGHPLAPVMLDDAARTAQQAADGLGVALGQIAKSIIFRRKPDGVAVLVITSGDRRVCEAKVAALVCGPGQTLGRANAEFVKTATGFSIGGVSPLAHATAPVTLIDRDLFRFGQIWAAAGHPHAVFWPAAAEPGGLDGCARGRCDRDQPLMIMTGRLAWVSTFCATLPRIRASMPLRPCEPITIRSQPSAWAVSRMPS